MRAVLSMLGALLFASSSFGFDVSGDITTTTWAKANSPYRVTGTVTVLTGNTLTIEPGVDVPFVVNGSLIALGTETDSIRFLAGTSSEWGGIRLIGGGSSSIAYTRISGGFAKGASPLNRGGGVYVSGTGTHATIAHAVITDNSAALGGGIFSDASLVLEQSTLSRNSAEYGGGLHNYNKGKAWLTGCVVLDNSASTWGGGVYNQAATATIMSCTIADSSAPDGGSGVFSFDATITLANCIVVGEVKAYGLYPTITVRYTNIRGTLSYPYESYRTLEHVMNADPEFVDRANRGYRLRWGSPCIDSGDPDAPLDPDGTRADIGALHFGHGVSVGEPTKPVPFSLAQNRPNPFNGSTIIGFGLPAEGVVKLTIYDLNGRVVRVLHDGTMASGHHGIVWDGADAVGRPVASGVYFCRLTWTANAQHSQTNASAVSVRRMVLLR